MSSNQFGDCFVGQKPPPRNDAIKIWCGLNDGNESKSMSLP